MRHLVCVGLGYSARIVARRLHGAGWRISGSARTVADVEAIKSAGYDGLVFSGREPSTALRDALRTGTHLLISVPPGPSSEPVIEFHREHIVAAPSLQWIGYLSTIGVYGDRGGQWVDEASEPQPSNERSRQRLAAELEWTRISQDRGTRLQIFRLGGIYGPGRSAIDNLRAGTARRIVKAGQLFNRIHVEDVAGLVQAGIARASDASSVTVVNAVDDEPAPPQDVVLFAARLLGIEPPPEVAYETAELSPMAQSFYAESKRVANTRMKEWLAGQLQYPTYREGLASIVRNDQVAQD